MQQSFDTRLAQVLAEMELSQRDLANALGVSDAAVSRWVKGERLPSLGMALLISQKLRVPVAQLWNFNGGRG